MAICALAACAGDDPSPIDPFARYATTQDRLLIVDDDVGMDRRAVGREGNFDVSQFIPITDPDGGLEILFAARQPGVRLLGVTCMQGTVSVDVCMRSARHVLDLGNHGDIPVLRGAHDAVDLDRPSEAVTFMCRALHAFPKRVELAASGPLTNIATLLRRCPDAPQLWKKLYVMSGEFGMGSDIDQYSTVLGGDLNLSVDYPASRRVFEEAGDFDIYPNELMDDLLFTPGDFDYLEKKATPLALFLVDELGPWSGLFGFSNGWEGFPPHGMLGIAPILDGMYEGPVSDGVQVRVVAQGERRGRHYWGAVRTVFADTGPRHRIVWGLQTLGLREDYRARFGR